ncbi:hypothetical protein D3C74_402550 [compost metagenome]
MVVSGKHVISFESLYPVNSMRLPLFERLSIEGRTGTNGKIGVKMKINFIQFSIHKRIGGDIK